MLSMATVATRPPATSLAVTIPARSIWHSSQPPKISPMGLVSAGMATVRSERSPWGTGVLSMSFMVLARFLARCHCLSMAGRPVASAGQYHSTAMASSWMIIKGITPR